MLEPAEFLLFECNIPRGSLQLYTSDRAHNICGLRAQVTERMLVQDRSFQIMFTLIMGGSGTTLDTSVGSTISRPENVPTRW